MASSAVTNVSPPEWYTAGMQDLLKRTQNQVAQGLPIYQGDRVAGFSPWQIEGMNQVAGTVPAMQNGVNLAQAQNNIWLNPEVLKNVGLIPGVQGMRDSIQQSVGRMLTENLLPAVRSNSIVGNSLGGSRQGVAEGLAGGRALDATAQAISNLDFSAWQALLGQQAAAMDRSGTLAANLARPGQTLIDLGAMQQAFQQALLEAEKQKFQEEANAPYFGLDQLRATLGAGQVGQTQTSKAADPSWLNILLSGGLLYNTIFGNRKEGP